MAPLFFKFALYHVTEQFCTANWSIKRSKKWNALQHAARLAAYCFTQNEHGNNAFETIAPCVRRSYYIAMCNSSMLIIILCLLHCQRNRCAEIINRVVLEQYANESESHNRTANFEVFFRLSLFTLALDARKKLDRSTWDKKKTVIKLNNTMKWKKL